MYSIWLQGDRTIHLKDIHPRPPNLISDDTAAVQPSISSQDSDVRPNPQFGSAQDAEAYANLPSAHPEDNMGVAAEIIKQEAAVPLGLVEQYIEHCRRKPEGKLCDVVIEKEDK